MPTSRLFSIAFHLLARKKIAYTRPYSSEKSHYPEFYHHFNAMLCLSISLKTAIPFILSKVEAVC